MVVLFWFDLWQIFFLPTAGFELWTSGSLVLHSTTAQCWLLVFTSDNYRYLTLVQRDWLWYCSDWTCERFSFCPHWGLNWGPSWISSPALYHCTAVILFFTSVNFRYFTLVQWVGGGNVLIWPVRDFLFAHTRVWTGDLWISSPVLYHCTMPVILFFTSLKISGTSLWCSGIGGGNVLIWPVRDFRFAHNWGLNWGSSGSLVLHSNIAPCQLLVFISDNFRYLTLV